MPASARKRLEGLIRISESTAWSTYPEAASQRMVDKLAEVFECDLAFIHLLDVSGDQLIRYVGHGMIPERAEVRVTMATGRMLQMMTTHQPIFMDFLRPDPADSMPRGPLEFRSAVSVPLLVGGDMLGMFSIVYKTQQHWTDQDIEYLLEVGRLLGITVQHAQIARKTADLEILLERKRLSGELHDHLSQLVSTINIGVETALLSWEECNTERVRNDLERIKSVGHEAARALREEMLSLRLPTSESEELIQRVKEYILRFEKQWGIDTDLQVEDGLEHVIVSTQMELQFMRILHESLSNVIRHATASHVSVLLQGDRDRLCLQIHDNGRGFNPEDVSSERLGLRIMRERAESLGGEITIESSSETGTTVRIDVPLYAW